MTDEINKDDNQELTVNDILDQSEAVKEPPKEETKLDDKMHATLRQPYSAALENPDKSQYLFKFPSVTLDKLVSLENYIENINDPTFSKWREVVSDSVNAYTPASYYVKRFKEPTSEFEQGLLTKEEELLQPSGVKTKDKVGELRGEVALLKVAQFLKLGEIVRVPLYHSGLWLTIKPPGEKEILDFFNNIYKDKIAFGRLTNGFTLSNFSAITNNELIDFVLRHVHATNVKDLSISELKKHIYLNDLYTLAWGFAMSFYPDGFDISRACINEEENCNYVTSERVNLGKLLWVDNNSLSEYQKAYMSDYRANSKTKDEWEKYKAEHVRAKTSYFTYEAFKFNLKQPTLMDHATYGLKWVTSIIREVEEKLIGETASDDPDSEYFKKKDELINEYIKVSILNQYRHYIESIEMGDNTIVDPDTIDQVLVPLSNDNTLRVKFLEEVSKFIEDTTIAVIGIPTYRCPKCNKEQNEPNMPQRFIDVIPLDVLNLFFGLISLRTSVILTR
jgi:hypothetical protein